MIIKNKKEVSSYINGTFIKTSKEWKNRQEWYGFDSFMLTNPKWWNGGFKPDCTAEEKASFYNMVNETVHLILKFAEAYNDESICIGPFVMGTNFAEWKDLDKYDSFHAMKDFIDNRQYALIKTNDDINIIGLIVENNFRYFTHIGILLKNANTVIYPTHNTEIMFFSDSIQSVSKTVTDIIKNTAWSVCLE